MDFKKYEKELNKAGYFISADQVTNRRGDVVGQMDPYGEFHYSDDDMASVICKAAQAEAKVEEAKPVKKTKRARDEDGHFKADDPTTPDINEAWEE